MKTQKVQNKHNRAGFTLVETLVSILIFSIIMIGSSLVLKNIFTISGQQVLVLDGIDQARIALAAFTNEIRNATNGNDGAYPLNRTDDTQLIFFSSYGATGTKVNRIRYYTNNGVLYKGVVVPSGTPLTYDIGNETVSSVLTNLGTTSLPLFSYYNDSYAGTSSPLVQPVNINDVNFVQINLTLLRQEIRNSTSTFSFSVGATMRNLKTNLGN